MPRVRMLIDARTLEPDTVGRADICVIGSGAAGITLAMELIDSGRTVLLLESGGSAPDPAVTDLAAGEIVGAPMPASDQLLELDELRLRFFGGTTNHWAGHCRPLRPIDFEERDGLFVSGWPIRHDDLIPYWERAAEWVRITSGEFDPQVWTDRLGVPPPLPATRATEPVVFQVTFPTRFGEIYGAELAASESVTVWQHANVVNLATSDGRSIDRVDIRTLDGSPLRAEATCYVLATGGIENARLLLASTDAATSGLGNRTDQVGRYFAEHLQVTAAFGLLEADSDALIGYKGVLTELAGGRHAGFSHGVKWAVSLTDEFLREEQTTGFDFQMLPDIYPGSGWRQDEGAGVDEVAALLAAEGSGPAAVVFLQGQAEQELNPESRVTLGEERDALGMRRTRLDWRYRDRDRTRILSNMRVVAEDFGAAGLGRLQLVPGASSRNLDVNVENGILQIFDIDPAAIDLDNFPIGVGFHHLCTTRMSKNPRDGVVDANCRMHEVDNLWVAGSSVFGTGGVATPTFNIVALAVRLADHLQDVLR